jgi:signal peptidase I
MTYAPTDQARDLSAPSEPQAQRRGLGCALEIIETLVLTLVIYLLIHNFVAQPFQVEQSSMVPTVLEGEYVLIDKVSPRFNDYQRGDIVVFTPPSGIQTGDVPFIKRVIGVPGDNIRLDNGRVYVTPKGRAAVRLDEPYINTDSAGKQEPTIPRDANGTTQWTVASGTYFVMGDNRTVSEDSRVFGPIPRDLIIGRAWLRYFPLDRIGFMNRPAYAGLSSTTASLGRQAYRSATGAGRRQLGAQPDRGRASGADRLLRNDPGVDGSLVVEQLTGPEPQVELELGRL